MRGCCIPGMQPWGTCMQSCMQWLLALAPTGQQHATRLGLHPRGGANGRCGGYVAKFRTAFRNPPDRGSATVVGSAIDAAPGGREGEARRSCMQGGMQQNGCIPGMQHPRIVPRPLQTYAAVCRYATGMQVCSMQQYAVRKVCIPPLPSLLLDSGVCNRDTEYGRPHGEWHASVF